MMENNVIQSNNRVKGSYGEILAERYLKDKGYKILIKNFVTPIGEIDIICKDKSGRIIFVEVKERATLAYGYPREAVNFYKQKKIRMVAELYLKRTRNLNAYTRFDVIEILDGEVTHLEGAF